MSFHKFRCRKSNITPGIVTTKPHLGQLARGTASSYNPYIGENSAKRMAQHLLSSAYATPGRRASGRIGVVPNDPKVIDWGRFNPRGLVVAQVVTTAFVENVRAPCFVMATSVMKGKRAVTSLFYVWAFVHPEGFQDRVVCLGMHCLTHQYLQQYYGKE